MPVSSRQVITGRHAGLLSGERRLRSAPVHWSPAWVAVYPALLRTRCLTDAGGGRPSLAPRRPPTRTGPARHPRRQHCRTPQRNAVSHCTLVDSGDLAEQFVRHTSARNGAMSCPEDAGGTAASRVATAGRGPTREEFWGRCGRIAAGIGRSSYVLTAVIPSAGTSPVQDPALPYRSRFGRVRQPSRPGPCTANCAGVLGQRSRLGGGRRRSGSRPASGTRCKREWLRPTML